MLDRFGLYRRFKTVGNRTGHLPVFDNGCYLKRVGLFGVKPPAFPVDSLESGGKQRHQPVGLSTTGRPYLIHATASNKYGCSIWKKNNVSAVIFLRLPPV